MLPSLSVAPAAQSDSKAGRPVFFIPASQLWLACPVTGASPSRHWRHSLSRQWLPEGAVCVFSTVASCRKPKPSSCPPSVVTSAGLFLHFLPPSLPSSFLSPDIQSVFHSSALLPVLRWEKKKVNNYTAWVQPRLHPKCEHAWELSHKS